MTASRSPTADKPLAKGWTTGACAAAAAKAAFTALLGGGFPDPVRIRLPKGELPDFPLAETHLEGGVATAAVIKDAGDDPDITHGATIRAMVRALAPGAGLRFVAGEGVGTVTRPGLPVPVGEPAINPKPREIIRDNLAEVAEGFEVPLDLEVRLSIPGGEALAAKTWNPRLGIVGGLSVLGTTGIVHPFSCSAWIHSIHRGIDVARANGFAHIAGSTGSTSEDAVQRHYDLPLEALIDMGDFAGGMLKYLRRHPVPHVTVAGGFAKMVKLSQGNLDLHSARSQVDLARLARRAARLGAAADLAERIAASNTAAEALGHARDAGLPLAEAVAAQARDVALATLAGAAVAPEVMIVDRAGAILAVADGGAPS
ncbi:cobalt-precorrin-5B (C(1))-methyltransferase [Marivibrio halodurans]|uniref:Cobalt-precorrin-5B C(1)-methyltransferase n=1 Tax=Marivibrio halodurans TaxID=2039722 RepID=A0A8J7S3L7_9PROT|nr:cobalt-precorrin-5B (C(1))-methyltransferase [Marivibrio halodurans]MBP5858089.1 cobalt-precorrin-5B (C(1))-methyltransferase [Marivibrio halodurans]